MSLARVTVRPDGGISITRYAWETRRPDESVEAFMERATPWELRNLPHADVDESELPSEAEHARSRHAWRLRNGRVQVDPGVLERNPTEGEPHP